MQSPGDGLERLALAAAAVAAAASNDFADLFSLVAIPSLPGRERKLILTVFHIPFDGEEFLSGVPVLKSLPFAALLYLLSEVR